MKANPMAPRPEESRSLAELATALRTARQVVHARRLAPVIREELVTAHRALLRAMEAYAGALTDRRLPIPPRLRDELRLQRELGQQQSTRRSGSGEVR